MHLQRSSLILLSSFLLVAHLSGTEPKPETADLKADVLNFDPFTWPNEVPKDCPFERSTNFNAIRFLGVKNPPGGHYGMTFQKIELLRNKSP